MSPGSYNFVASSFIVCYRKISTMRIIDKIHRKFSPPGKWQNSERRVNVLGPFSERSINVGIDPANQFLTIIFNSKQTGNGHIRIYSLDGYEIYNRNLKQYPGKNNFEVDINSFREGVYIVETVRHTSSSTVETTYNKIEITAKDTN
jgi:hypothetical protein